MYNLVEIRFNGDDYCLVIKIIMMQTIIISPKILLSFILLLSAINSLTTIPIFQINNKYLQAGTYTVNTSPLTGNTTADTVSSFSYTVTFSRTHSNYKASCSLVGLDFKFTAARQMNVTTYICTRSTTTLGLCLQTMRASKISALNMRYILVDSPLSNKMTHFYSIGSYYVQNATTKVFDPSNPASVSFSIPTINIATATQSIVGINGVNASCSDSSLSVDIKISSYYSSSNVLQVDITSSSTTVLNLASVAVWIIGFNVQDAMAWPWPAARATVGNFLTSSPYSDSGNLIQTYNTFWGVSYLKTSNQNSLTFSSSFAVNTSITGVSVDQSFEWKFIVFEVKECDASTPYYMTSEDKCYDICPNFYYESNSDKLCKACTASAYDCLKCVTNQTCSSCDPNTRVLNSITNRCDPKPGYYESGSLNATACDSNCKTCILDSKNCTSCYVSNYLAGNNTCSPCISNCDSCNDATSCSTCSNSYQLDNNSVCVLGFNCSQITNCATCTTVAGCIQCSAGFSQINSTLCSSVCGDGLLSSTEQCDIGNLTDGCINCYIEAAHFCTGTVGALSTCSDCAVNCLNCTSLTACSLCKDHFLLSASFSCQANCSEINLCLNCSVVSNAVRCNTCTFGYAVSPSYQCVSVCGNGVIIGSEGCDDNNTVSGDGCSPTCVIEDGFACTVTNSKSVCVPCLGATYQSPDKTACLPCANYDCLTCSANGDCLTCNASQNRYLDVNTHRCLPLDGFYDDGSNSTALPCDPQCVTCSGTGNNTCLSCKSNEVLDTNTCNKCSVVNGQSCGACNKSGSSFICTLCLDGTVLNNGNCTTPPSTKTEKDGVNLLLILLPLLLGLLCCCCLILFCIWRRRKNQENKVEEELEEGGEIQNIDQNNEKIEQALKIENLDESKATFDEKALTIKKKKYRGGDPNKSNIKSKKRRALLPQETEENELSLQQFKDTLQMRHPQTKNQNKITLQAKEAAMHVIPLQQEKHQQVFEMLEQPENLEKLKKQKRQDKQEVINEDKLASQPKDDGVKSQVHNEDILRDKDRSEFSDNETKQMQDEQEQERGR